MRKLKPLCSPLACTVGTALTSLLSHWADAPFHVVICTHVGFGGDHVGPLCFAPSIEVGPAGSAVHGADAWPTTRHFVFYFLLRSEESIVPNELHGCTVRQ